MSGPTILTHAEVLNELMRLGILPGEMEPPDAQLCIVKHDWLVNTFIPWWLGWRKPYAAERRDCDDIAELFKVKLKEAFQDHFSIEAGLTVARFFVYQRNDFGGVLGDGGDSEATITHALDMVRTERGWFIVEPQTGTIAAIEAYPNRAGIIQRTQIF